MRVFIAFEMLTTRASTLVLNDLRYSHQSTARQIPCVATAADRSDSTPINSNLRPKYYGLDCAHLQTYMNDPPERTYANSSPVENPSGERLAQETAPTDAAPSSASSRDLPPLHTAFDPAVQGRPYRLPSVQQLESSLLRGPTDPPSGLSGTPYGGPEERRESLNRNENTDRILTPASGFRSAGNPITAPPAHPLPAPDGDLPLSLQPISSHSAERYSVRHRSLSHTSASQSHRGVATATTLGKRKFSDPPSYTQPPGPSVTYESSLPAPVRTQAQALRIRQQPRACRACGFGERDRRVIDPPPVLSLLEEETEISSSVFIAHVSLWNEEGNTDVTHPQPSNRKLGGTLMGNLVASCIDGRDEHGRAGKFFVFTDLSCRTYGRYRLKFSLVKLPIGETRTGATAPILGHVMSDVFTVYSAKVSGLSLDLNSSTDEACRTFQG